MEAAVFDVIRDRLKAGKPTAIATVIKVNEQVPSDRAFVEPDDPSLEVPPLGGTLVVLPDAPPVGSLGNAALERVVTRDALGALESGQSFLRHYGPQGQAGLETVAVFIESLTPPRRMLIFGATDFAAALVRVAKILGYRVTVCDAREVFATAARFPGADDVVVDWPHRFLATVADELSARDAICVLSHDERFDVPAIAAALDTSVGYIGVMGSRRTVATRFDELREVGVSEQDLTRLMAPIGLDIGARTPEETAVSIMAEIVARAADSPAPSLRDHSGPIHRSGR